MQMNNNPPEPRVNELKISRDFISNSYNFQDNTPMKEFLQKEKWALTLTASGLSKAQLRSVYDGLIKAGLAPEQKEIP